MMRIYKRFGFLLGIVLTGQIHAVTCFITMVKGHCWKAYDVSVDVLDANSGQKKISLVIPENQMWVRQPFECKPGDTLALTAKFSPAFWAGDEEKTFPGQRYWKLPTTVNAGETGWNVTVCFPKYFANVPTPPDAATNCDCDLSTIPKLAPPSA
ncbi:MAG TPA: hypothetical protein VHD33_07395 [Legionellaceae bacterium]|nr:hypothetical protein [Legionellaceae bacterium]